MRIEDLLQFVSETNGPVHIEPRRIRTLRLRDGSVRQAREAFDAPFPHYQFVDGHPAMNAFCPLDEVVEVIS